MMPAEKFVRAYGWRGPSEWELMTAGDDLTLIEINPRFPAWVYAATGVGVDLPGHGLEAWATGAVLKPPVD